jgi:hypothetical protein
MLRDYSEASTCWLHTQVIWISLGCLNHNLLIFIKHFESHRDVFTLKLTPMEEINNLINMLY